MEARREIHKEATSIEKALGPKLILRRLKKLVIISWTGLAWCYS